SYYRKYAWDSLPVLIPHYIQQNIRWYEKVPIQGVSTYSEPGDWVTYELSHYILAALAWNPDADIDVLIQKFAEARYGPVSVPAIGCIRGMETVVRTDCALPNSTPKSPDELMAGRQKIQTAAAELEKSAVSVTDPAFKLAVARLLLDCQYAILDQDI